MGLILGILLIAAAIWVSSFIIPAKGFKAFTKALLLAALTGTLLGLGVDCIIDWTVAL